MMILSDLETDISLHGVYRAAYPKRFFATSAFIATVVKRAQAKCYFTVLYETESHAYAAVHDPSRLHRSETIWGGAADPTGALAKHIEI